MVEKRMGRKFFNDEPIVAGGLMGDRGDIVVDSVHEPKMVYGIADGGGDFLRSPSKEQIKVMTKIKKAMHNNTALSKSR